MPLKIRNEKLAGFWKSFQISLECNSIILLGQIQIFCNQSAQEILQEAYNFVSKTNLTRIKLIHLKNENRRILESSSHMKSNLEARAKF